ncbi:S8 family serine peptidase [Rhizobacter sp. Root1221]|uniref:S8 family serine peptidase n=1 Tax=Rhizobacter sp. Root1221 TaxID=1736433 RepID=UPI0006F1FB4E|nr:S8 family serine peptidase [Rhizobacter sp. Root1221]KQW00381.1 hypothetical protein ASC87_17640 [Rhizobacter sp. Root1221]
MRKQILNAWCAGAVLLLASCGGGGGGDGSVTLSGTLSLPEHAAVDSDTNDPNQAGRAPNNTFAGSQALVSPVYLIGSVNVPQAGAAGANYQAGDPIDGYVADLQPGQVIELEFTANPLVNDLDLYVYAEGASANSPPIGQSSGVNAFECLRIQTAGRYHVAVNAYAGASIYNLRIGAPTDSSTCANTVSSTSGVVAGEVVARALSSDPAANRLRAKALGAGALSTAAPEATSAPVLLHMPTGAAEREAALDQLQALGQGTADSRQASARVLSAAAPDLPPALREVIDTVHYAKHLQRTGLYAYAEPNYRVALQSDLVGAYPPADRLYSNQRWHFEMIGMPGAMATLVPLRQQFTRRPIVAVIDTGIVSDHPDFTGQVAYEASFTGGGTWSASADDPSSPGVATAFHGTHVAGIVAATTFESTGVAGVAPMARLMPIRVFAKDATGSTTADVAQAILYAAGLANASGQIPGERADVINLSLGSTRACPAAYADAVTRARAAGVIVVAASGNDALTARDAPANCAGVVSVGALDARRQTASYSNTDPQLSLAAPGGDPRQSTTGTGLPDLIYSTLGDFSGTTRVPSYGGKAGTSMAAPHVAGVMALMRYANPGITVAQVDALLGAGLLTDDLGAAGRDSGTGFGLVNASKAVDEALKLAGTNPTPVPGTVVALPSSLDFGSVRTSAELQVVLQGGASTETVTSVVSSTAAVTVGPQAVDASGLGTYTVTVSRDTLPLGSTFATLRVTTSARQFDVQVIVTKTAAGATSTADFGRVYVLVVDASTGNPIHQVAVNATNGVYPWRIAGVTATQVQIFAGSDIDNDTLLCQRGEACGGFPQFDAAKTVIELSGDRNDLNFDLVPYGGVNTGETRSQGLKALPAGP